MSIPTKVGITDIVSVEGNTPAIRVAARLAQQKIHIMCKLDYGPEIGVHLQDISLVAPGLAESMLRAIKLALDKESQSGRSD